MALKKDSTKYYLKLSGSFNYGITKFLYSSSHGYQSSYKYNNDSYGGSIKNAKIMGQSYGFELKVDAELFFGSKIVSGLFSNSLNFKTPTGNGTAEYLSSGPIQNLSYEYEEQIKIDNSGLYIGFGYGKRIKKFIFDGDASLEFYRTNSIYAKRTLNFNAQPLYDNVPSNSYSYQASDLNAYNPGMALRFSANSAYKINNNFYVKCGFLMRSSFNDKYSNGMYTYSGFEYESCKISYVKSYMINIGIALTLK